MPRPYVASPTALRLRLFLRNKQHVSPFVVSTLLRLNRWADSIQADGSEAVLRRTLTVARKTSNPIEQIAEDLVENAAGIERQLLLKSLQEALFCCVGFRTNLTPTQIEIRLTQFLDRQSKAGLIQRFLSSYFFNYVWFHTGELFRGQALTSKMFEKDIEEVDRICQKTVVSAYGHELAAEELIRNIERRLRGI